MHLRLPRQGQRGQAKRAARVRRRGRGVPDRGGAGRPRQLLQRVRPARQGHRRSVEARPVLQPARPRKPLRDHRPRDLGRHRRQGDALRRRRRHRWNHHRRGPLPQGSVRRPGAGHRRRPRGLGVLRRNGAALPGRGCRRGLLALRLRPDDSRRDHRGVRRRLLRHDAAPGPRGGPAGRRLLRNGSRRGHRGRRESRA